VFKVHREGLKVLKDQRVRQDHKGLKVLKEEHKDL
jgi:hypothetical protein